MNTEISHTINTCGLLYYSWPETRGSHHSIRLYNHLRLGSQYCNRRFFLVTLTKICRDPLPGSRMTPDPTLAMPIYWFVTVTQRCSLGRDLWLGRKGACDSVAVLWPWSQVVVRWKWWWLPLARVVCAGNNYSVDDIGEEGKEWKDKLYNYITKLYKLYIGKNGEINFCPG